MRNNRGFTLVELFIIVACIFILASVLVPRLMEKDETVKKMKQENNIQREVPERDNRNIIRII